ncbi:MAG: ABC transporter substrate-binding protein, partial [Vulcanimicrobiota bacterium]
MKKNKINKINIFIWLPLLVFSIFLAGTLIGARQHFARTRPHDILTIAISKDPIYLNPVLASDSNSMTVNSFIFSPLVRYSPEMNIEPELAEKWVFSDDGTEVSFKIREGIKWHDGNELTADDCVFTFQKLLNPETNTFNRGLMRVDGEDI